MTRMVECWGEDIPDGTMTDFKRAVQAKDDETVVFSWCEYPDKLTRDEASQKMMSDPRMAEKAVNKRWNDWVEEEAEKAARKAMNDAFLRGEGGDSARVRPAPSSSPGDPR